MKVLLGTAALGAACSSSSSNTDPGYGVVDPMPPPARCAGPIGTLTGTARFEPGPNGTSDLILRLDPPKDAGTKFAIVSGPMTENATVKHEIDAQGALVVRVTNPPASPLDLTIPVALTCSEGPANATVTINWTAEQRQAQTPIPVTAQPSYNY